MNYTEQFKEHIEYTFATLCKVALRYEAINARRDMSRIVEREIVLLYFFCGYTDKKSEAKTQKQGR